MALIQVTVIEGESTRRHIWCLVAEVVSGDWGVAGHTLTADDIRALARGAAAGEPE